MTEILDATGDGNGKLLDGPQAIAVDVLGNVYVAGLFSDNAFRITSGGVITEILDVQSSVAGRRPWYFSAASVRI